MAVCRPRPTLVHSDALNDTLEKAARSETQRILGSWLWDFVDYCPASEIAAFDRLDDDPIVAV
jgi:hypothetical protein